MQRETILCVSNRDWHSMWRNNQQIVSRLAARHRIFYVEPGRTPGQSVASEFFNNLPNFFKLQTRQLHENLILVPTPPSLPMARQLLPRRVLQVAAPLIVRFNALILIRQIRQMIAVFEIKRPILWLYDPFHLQLVGQFGEKISCYYNYDEFADIIPNTRVRELVQRYDDCLSSRVDLVFASSGGQWERRKQFNPKTFLIPNGVDFDLFNRALNPDLPLPTDIAQIPRPIIGFAGGLGYHIDVCLLRRIAESYPNCSLVLVGPDELTNSRDTKRLKSLHNVFFLGQKDRPQLPNYLKAFNVTLMPWQLTGHFRTAYPLKLHEYLAAGKTIVATALPELMPFGHLIQIAKTHEEFIACIHKALDDHDPTVIQARVATARENTWDKRVAEINRILDIHLQSKETELLGEFT